MTKNSQYILALLILLLSSCSDRSTILPSSSGLSYQVLIVADPSFTATEAGVSLSKILEKDVTGLPQVERSFNLMYAAPEHFDTSLKIVHNIIIVNIGSEYRTAKMSYVKDAYATPQRILTIEAPDEESFSKYVLRKSEAIVDFFSRFELQRSIATLSNHYCENTLHKVDSIFHCSIYVPAELHFTKVGSNFLWASTNTATADQNFVMYSYPYSGKDTISLNSFIQKRDSVMKINMEGSYKDSYMSTETKGLTCKYSTNGPALIVRGLWRVKGDQMGGPFVSHVFIDKRNHRVLTLEIFIYSPDKMKANLLRNLEASLYTFSLTGEKERKAAEEVK
jgi:hypothetical protein